MNVWVVIKFFTKLTYYTVENFCHKYLENKINLIGYQILELLKSSFHNYIDILRVSFGNLKYE